MKNKKQRNGTSCRSTVVGGKLFLLRAVVRVEVHLAYLADQCTGANPRYPMVSEIRQMYLNAYYGAKQE